MKNKTRLTLSIAGAISAIAAIIGIIVGVPQLSESFEFIQESIKQNGNILLYVFICIITFLFIIAIFFIFSHRKPSFNLIKQLGISALIIMIVTVVLVPTLGVNTLDTPAINGNSLPISFTEDYDELSNMYYDCINMYNSSQFQEKYDDIQNNYLLLENIYKNWQNANDNVRLEEFIEKRIDFERKCEYFVNKDKMFTLKCENFTTKYNNVEREYFSDFLDEDGNVISSLVVTEEILPIADRFLVISDMRVDLHNKIDVNADKCYNINYKLSKINDKRKIIADRTDEIMEELNDAKEATEQLKQEYGLN